MKAKTLLRLAEGTALMAGVELNANRTEWSRVVSESGREVKIKADREVEAIILESLQQATTFPLLTEERGWQTGDSKEAYLWVVDPLDGSFNYYNNIPVCCVSIALYHAGEPLLGVVYDFNRHELFSGIVGEGAWLNRFPIHVSSVKDVRKAVLHASFPMTPEFIGFAQQCRKVRMTGSAALALAYIACGRADCYHETRTMFWDVAAGLALVKAAGGAVHVEGERLDAKQTVYASNGQIILW